MARRNRELTIRVSSAELEQIRAVAQAQGLGMADLARRLLLEAGAADVRPTGRRRQTAPRQRPAPSAPPELVREIARVGNNLNQIARWCNHYKSAATAVQVLAALAAIDRQLDTVLSSYRPKPPEDCNASEMA